MSTIDLPTEPPQAVAKIERHESALGRALSVAEMTERLRLIKAVMQENMKEGEDYGKVPGCGDKPGLFQPGAQKLSMMFQLSPEVRQETISEFENYHRGYRLVVRVSNGPKFADGVGECSTLESKYRYRNAGRVCPKCHKETVIESKPEWGGGYVCYKKKGGCGEKFAPKSELGLEIAKQNGGKVENENPADHWNTVRKMAFKRGFVHAIINATNTSELWSQDLEDLAANGVTRTPHNDDDDGDLGPQKQSGAGGAHKATAHPSATNPSAAAVAKGPGATGTATNREASSTRVGTFIPIASEARRDHVISLILEADQEQEAKAFLVAWGSILENEGLCDWSLDCVPVNDAQFRAFVAAMLEFVDRGEFLEPYPRNGQRFDNPSSKPVEVPRDNGVGTWRDVEISFGKNKGTPLGKMTPNQIAGYIKITQPPHDKWIKDGKTYTRSKEETAKRVQLYNALQAARVELGLSDNGGAE